jgi:hypothetical protein
LRKLAVADGSAKYGVDVFAIAFALDECACWGMWEAEGAAESGLLCETSL